MPGLNSIANMPLLLVQLAAAVVCSTRLMMEARHERLPSPMPSNITSSVSKREMAPE